MKAEKFFRPFQRKLTESEYNARLFYTQRVIERLREDKVWKDWITRVMLFGSMARHEAKIGSDVDIAILTQQENFFVLDYNFTSSDYIRTFVQYKMI